MNGPWLAAFVARVLLIKPPFDRTRHRLVPGLPSRTRRALGKVLKALAPRLPYPPSRAVMERAPNPSFPRIVWLYWHDGEAAAPPLVHRCLRSWRELNPGWEVRVLDRDAAAQVSDLEVLPPATGISHLTDMLRVDLMARRGGVWADATCLCVRPLDEWLPARLAPEGFFALHRNNIHWPAESWFLAACPGAPLAAAWAEAARTYWRLRRRTDNYFIIHYLFEWMIFADRGLAAAWARVPSLDGWPAHHLQDLLHAGGEADERTRFLAQRTLADQETVPVHKLDWRIKDGCARLEAALAAGGV